MTDERVLPPLQREFRSPDGRFVFSVRTADGWRTQRAHAELREAGRGKATWSRTLPHQQGPRAVVVGDSGTTLLIDEWINVIPDHALMLIAADGRVVADYSGEAVIAKLGVARLAITHQARFGVWRSTEPVVRGTTVMFEAGGRRVAVSLADGRLTIGD